MQQVEAKRLRSGTKKAPLERGLMNEVFQGLRSSAWRESLNSWITSWRNCFVEDLEGFEGS